MGDFQRRSSLEEEKITPCHLRLPPTTGIGWRAEPWFSPSWDALGET